MGDGGGNWRTSIRDSNAVLWLCVDASGRSRFPAGAHSSVIRCRLVCLVLPAFHLRVSV